MKTLKEFTWVGFDDEQAAAQLRGIAEEWVKKLEEKSGGDTSFCLYCGEDFEVCVDSTCKKAEFGSTCLAEYDYESHDISAVIMFITHFFNLEEEQ